MKSKSHSVSSNLEYPNLQHWLGEMSLYYSFLYPLSNTIEFLNKIF